MSEREGGPLVVHNDEARLAEALRRCGVEVGSVGGDTFRRVVANRLLASDWLRAHDDRIRAEVWDEGARAVAGEPWDDFRRAPWPNPYAAALRAAAGTPTHDTTEEETP